VLTASGASTYAWSTGSNVATTTVTASGTYTVTGSDGGGCTGTASVLVVEYALPTVLATSNSPVCQGASAQFQSSGALSYAWTGPGGFTTTGQYPDRDAVTTADAGTYTVIGTDANGCQNSAIVNLTVNICPEICGNGVDDDGDGLVDGNDTDCPCGN
jgi:hypothetical protein